MIRRLSLILAVFLLLACSGCLWEVDRDRGGHGEHDRGGHGEHEQGGYGERR